MFSVGGKGVGRSISMKFIAPQAEETAENRTKFMLASDHVSAPTALFNMGILDQAI